MRNIFNIVSHPLFSGSLIMMTGSTFANAINYLYHLSVGRWLGPSGYGELATLISLIGLLGIIPASISLVVIRYVSASKTEESKIALISWLRIKIFQLSFAIFIMILLIAPAISSFLHISNISYVIAIAVAFLFSLPAFYNRSILQGLLKFKESTISVLMENSIRLVVSILLIFLGFHVGGAMMGFVISAAVGWYIANRYLKTYFRKNPQTPPNIRSMISYSIPVIVQSIALIALYSSDVILVKHFFSSHDAGIYASLSTLGKIIFFGTGPIGAVMFPLVSQRYSEGNNYRKIFIYSFLATFILSILILAIYWLLPAFAINLLYGSAYLEAANLLIWFGIFITLFTFSSLLVSFHLSLGRTKVVLLPAIASIAQIAAIWFYHGDLFTVIMLSILVSALLLSLLLIYSVHNWNEKKITPSHKVNIDNSSII